MSNEKEPIEESGTMKEKINQILSFDDLVSKNKIISKDNKLHKPEVGSEETDGKSKEFVLQNAIINIIGGMIAINFDAILQIFSNVFLFEQITGGFINILTTIIMIFGFVALYRGFWNIYKLLKMQNKIENKS